MDAGKYGDAWDAASPALRAVSTADGWQQYGELEFRPRGKLGSRVEMFSLYTRRDEGGKARDYLVVSSSTRASGTNRRVSPSASRCVARTTASFGSRACGRRGRLQLHRLDGVAHRGAKKYIAQIRCRDYVAGCLPGLVV